MGVTFVYSPLQGGGRGSPDSPDSVGFVSGVAPGAVTATSSASPSGFVDTPVYTFTLPDLTLYPGKFFGLFLVLMQKKKHS